ncbi:MAG TPA: hypothetical protein PLN33_09075 [Hyphomonadaceae bacterium]|jgi:hypothetical protein|nr:hypothetical protein [Hyphomonadaceae bacterium]HPN06426.1 hypothetical protein [Hyphomonadaceae bacterium]
MLELSLRLAAVLDELPVAVVLVSPMGRLISKTGSMIGLLGTHVPSFDAREASRWNFKDAGGATIPASDWPSGRALRGERHYDGMIGTFIDGAPMKVKIISMPVFDPSNAVGAITFLQALDTKGRSAEGSDRDLQHRLIDELVKSMSRAYMRDALAS